jgi:serine O-acetyltransferase
MHGRAPETDGADPVAAAVAGLRGERQRWRQAHPHHREHGAGGFPSRAELERTIDCLASGLFPLRLGSPDTRPDNEDAHVARYLTEASERLTRQVDLELAYWRSTAGAAPVEAKAHVLVGTLVAALPSIRAQLDSDVEAAFDGDPAARSVDEVLLCYPSLHAITHHRIAHMLYTAGAPLVARVIAEIAHARTGIDIHPGAQIGRRFFIDHGAGVVIGETAVIGAGVRLYQGVTLGAKSFPVGANGQLVKGDPRHPIIGDDVIIYAGATILGRIEIGAGSVIGGNVWLTESLPPGSEVHQSRPDLVIRNSIVGSSTPSDTRAI